LVWIKKLKHERGWHNNPHQRLFQRRFGFSGRLARAWIRGSSGFCRRHGGAGNGKHLQWAILECNFRGRDGVLAGLGTFEFVFFAGNLAVLQLVLRSGKLSGIPEALALFLDFDVLDSCWPRRFVS